MKKNAKIRKDVRGCFQHIFPRWKMTTAAFLVNTWTIFQALDYVVDLQPILPSPNPLRNPKQPPPHGYFRNFKIGRTNLESSASICPQPHFLSVSPTYYLQHLRRSFSVRGGHGHVMPSTEKFLPTFPLSSNYSGVLEHCNVCPTAILTTHSYRSIVHSRIMQGTSCSAPCRTDQNRSSQKSMVQKYLLIFTCKNYS